MRRHPLAIVVLALVVGACSGSDGPTVVDNEPVGTSASNAAPSADDADTPTADNGDDTGDDGDAGPTTVEAPDPTADPATVFPDGVAADLILVQDFDGAAQLASYTPDGDLAAVYVAGADELAWQPIWAPDGRSVAWASTGRDGDWSLVVADADGTRRGTYELPGRPDYLTFDPTASRVGALTPSPDGFGMVVVELDGGGWSLIDAGRPYFSDFAPEGDRLIGHVGDDLRIVVIDGTTESIGITTVGHQTPVWHPDGDRLIVTDEVDDTISVVEYDTATGETVEIARFADFVTFSVDRSGRSLAVSSFAIDAEPDTTVPDDAIDAFRAAPPGDPRSGLWVVDLDTGVTTRLATEPTTTPLFDPTGTKVLVRDAASALGTWTIYDLDGSPITSVQRNVNSSLMPNYLPYWDQFARSQTLWSPDGDRFVHVGTDDAGQAGVWIHDADVGGESTLLVEGQLAFWSPT